MNYRNIANSFSSALAEMSYNLRAVQKEVQIADSADMRTYVIDLYIGIFKFLCYTMRWYKSRKKRFIGSLSKSFLDNTVKDLVGDIKKTVKKIYKEGEYIERDRIRSLVEKATESTTCSERTEDKDMQSGGQQSLNLQLQIAAIDNRNDSPKSITARFTAISEGLVNLESLGRLSAGVLEAVAEHDLHSESFMCQKNSYVHCTDKSLPNGPNSA